MLQVRNGGNGKSTSPLRVLLYSRVSSLQQARYGHSTTYTIERMAK